MDEHDRLIVLERDVAHIDKTLTETRADMKTGFSEVRTELRTEVAGIHKKIDTKFNIILGMFGGGVLFIVGFIYFFFGNTRGL